MKYQFNKVQFIGRISNEVNINLTRESSKQVGNISVALDVSGGRTLFVSVTAWNERADIIPKLLKGDLVYVDGRLDLDYKNKEKIIVTAKNIKLVHSVWFDKIGKTNEELEQLFAMYELQDLYSSRS